MATYTITDDGATIKIALGSDTDSLSKQGLSLDIFGTVVKILSFGETKYEIDYTTVSTPSVASAEALRSAIEAMLETASMTVAIGGGGAQVLTSTNVTDDSSVTAGATSIVFETSSDFSGSINGLTRVASRAYSFESAPGKTLPAIAYVTTLGSINIDKIV